MASHAGFHDVGAFPQSFESFPFLYVQIPFSHFCCISPESDPVAIQKHQPQVSSVPQICRRKLPNDAISHRLRKSWTQIMSRIRSNRHVSHPPLGKPFVVSHTHTHTPSTAQLVRCFTHPDLHRMSADVRCDLSSQELNQTPPGSPCLGTWVRRSRNPYNGSTGSFTQISCTTQCILYPIPSIGLEYLSTFQLISMVNR